MAAPPNTLRQCSRARYRSKENFDTSIAASASTAFVRLPASSQVAIDLLANPIRAAVTSVKGGRYIRRGYILDSTISDADEWITDSNHDWARGPCAPAHKLWTDEYAQSHVVRWTWRCW